MAEVKILGIKPLTNCEITNSDSCINTDSLSKVNTLNVQYNTTSGLMNEQYIQHTMEHGSGRSVNLYDNEDKDLCHVSVKVKESCDDHSSYTKTVSYINTKNGDIHPIKQLDIHHVITQNGGINPINHLDVYHVTYAVEERLGRWWQGLCLREKREKVILNGINLRVSSGEVTAILGNSGSGKTTILDIISNRANAGKKTGDVVYCGKSLTPSVFRKRAGYVLQSDNHMVNLTVKETLTYVAHLKFINNQDKHNGINARVELAINLSIVFTAILVTCKLYDKRDDFAFNIVNYPFMESTMPAGPGYGVYVSRLVTFARVDLAISQMRMRHVTDSIVGGVIRRGLSGGEKRRLSIATQLIQDPALLLLDEPTTGLDSFTAHSIIQTLSNLAKQYNKIVLLSIHQPRSDIFNLFDRIGILSQGEMVYYGAKDQLVDYFTQVGYPCPTYANPLDHYVDVCSIDRRSEQDEQTTLDRTLALKACYLKSNTYLSMVSDMEGHQQHEEYTEIKSQDKSASSCKYFKQTGILLKRLNVNIWRSNISMVGRLTQLLFFGFVLYIFLIRLTNDYTGIQDRTGLFFEVTSATPIMGLLNAIAMFPPLRDLYYRESADGLYKGAPFLTAYYIHILPFHGISSIIFAVWVYWGVGCYPDVGRFFIFFSIVLMLQYLGELFAVMFLCIFDSIALAQSINMLFFTVNVTVASGLLRASSSLLLPLQWLRYISYNMYASEIVMANEYHDLKFQCDNAPDNECSFTGDDYLEEFFPNSVENMTRNFLIMTSFILGMWIINVVAYKIKGVRLLH